MSTDPELATGEDLASNAFVAGLLYAYLGANPKVAVSHPRGNTFVIGTHYTRSRYQVTVHRISG